MFAFSKNNYDLCSRLLHTSVSDGAKSPRYWHKYNLLRFVVSVRCDSIRPKVVCSRQDLSFFVPIQSCLLLKKLAPHCPKPALTRGVSLKHRPILRWPRNASTSNEPNSIPFPGRTATRGGTGCMKRSATSVSFMTGAAATPVVLLSSTIKPQSYDSGLR